MLTKEQNDLLTQTGPGTPGGNMLRRYWQPVALSAELPPGGSPKPVRILGEDLVIFRDEQGRPGLLGLHCSHRGADLSYGRIEGGGLRCLYHGWCYDVEGNCLEQPGEPRGSTFKEKVKHPAYPCQEKGGVIFAYMGPLWPPLLPEYEFLSAPERHVFVNKVHHECNYLQGNEGNLDPEHLSHLHRVLDAKGERGGYFDLLAGDVAPQTEVERTRFGVRIFTVRQAGPEKQYLRVSNFVFPNLSAFPGNTQGDGYSVNWHVPIDDTSHWKFQFVYKRSAPLDIEAMRAQYDAELTADHRSVRTSANRYRQDREEQRTKTYTGMGRMFFVHDKFATEGQGPVYDRTQEHLGYTDKAIPPARQMMLEAIAAVRQGLEPPHLVRAADLNLFPDLQVVSEVVPRSMGWREYWRQRVGSEAPDE